MNHKTSHNAPVQPSVFRLMADLISIAGLVTFLLLFFAAQLPASQKSFFSEPSRKVSSCMMDRPGYLRGEIYGELKQSINLTGESLSCDGMPQPDGNGIRLFFSAGPGSPALVIGIRGQLENLAGEEHIANLTVIDQQHGRFYSTAGLERCWTRIEAVEPYQLQSTTHYRVDGMLYCAGALASLNDKQSITLGDIYFSGRLSFETE